MMKFAAGAVSPEGFGRGKAGQALGVGPGTGPVASPLPKPSERAALAADSIMPLKFVSKRCLLAPKACIF